MDHTVHFASSIHGVVPRAGRAGKVKEDGNGRETKRGKLEE